MQGYGEELTKLCCRRRGIDVVKFGYIAGEEVCRTSRDRIGFQLHRLNLRINFTVLLASSELSIPPKYSCYDTMGGSYTVIRTRAICGWGELGRFRTSAMGSCLRCANLSTVGLQFTGWY